MSHPSWRDSIVLPEISSGGRSLHVFETHSTLAPWIDATGDSSTTTAAFSGWVTSEHGTVTFESSHSGVDALKRALGCYIITRLPENGLDEALESLQGIWGFHAPPTVVGLPRLMARTIQGRLGTSSERLPLEIDGR